MSKKDFIALADKLRAMKPAHQPSDAPYAKGFADGEARNWCFTVESLADFCATANPAFKRDRWIAYINGTGGPNGGKPKA